MAGKHLKTRLAAIASALAVAASSAAQVFGDDFANATPGTYWQSVSGNPALAVTETNGRLQFSTTASNSVATTAFAGYAATNWRIRTTAEFRARVTVRSALAGVGAIGGSEVGVGFNLYKSGTGAAPNQLRRGLVGWLGTRRFPSLSPYRVLVVGESNASGAVTPLMKLWAPQFQTQFFDEESGSFVANIGIETILYVRYDPLQDILTLSTLGYLDPNAYEYLDFMLGDNVPVQLSLGGFARQPGTLTGSDAWLDTLRVDAGIVETAPTNVAATDGTSMTSVRVTWTPGMNATSQQVLRTAPGGTPELRGTVSPGISAFDDTGAVPLTDYTYTIRSVGPSGPGFDASDTGWRGLPAPTGVSASDGTSSAGVVVSWTAVGGASGYRVLRAVGTGTPVEVGAPSSNTYIDGSADPAVLYTYSVKARSDSGDGPASAGDTGWRNLPAPENVTATDGTSTANVEVSWSAVPGTTGHKLFRAAGAAAPTQIGGTLSASATSYTDTSAAAGVLYTYTVRGVSSLGNGLANPGENGWRNVAAPSGVNATDGSSSANVTVTWTAVPGASGYRVLRATGSDSPVSIGTPTATSFVDTGAAPATAYAYTVRARTPAGDSADGRGDAGWRNLPVPANVQASDGTSTAGVNVTWTAVPGATGYKVFRTIGTASPVLAGEPSGGSTTSLVDADAPPGIVCTFAVRAVCALGDSAASVGNTGWRNIAAPANVSATDGTSTANVTVTWSAAAGATGYRVFRALGAAAPVQVGTTLAAGATSFVDTTAAIGTVYGYTLRAVTAGGESAASAADAGFRALGTTAVTASDGTSTAHVALTWPAVAGASGYRVFRDGSESPLATPTTAAFNDTSAVPGVSYAYRVRAVTATVTGDLGTSDTGYRQLGAPASVAASDGEFSDRVRVTWAAAAGATGYQVFRSDAPAAILAATSGPSFDDTTVGPGVSRTYTVRATTTVATSAASAGNAGYVGIAAPTGVSATDGTTTANVTVTWAAVTGATGYRVYRALGSAAPVQVGQVAAAALTYADTAAVPGTEYAYTVRALAAAGPGVVGGPDTGYRQLAAPGSINASDGTSTAHVAVTWAAVTGATGYEVLRQEGSAEPTMVGTTAAPTVSLLDATAVPGMAYAYSVKAKSAVASSAAGAPNAGYRQMSAPSAVTATDGTSAAHVQVTWTAPAGATGHQVFRSGTAAPIGTVSGAATTFLDTTATMCTRFTYTVKATGAATGAVSASSAADAGWRNRAGPANVQATDNRTDMVKIAWNAVTGSPAVNGYRVMRQEGSGTPVAIGSESSTALFRDDTTAVPGVTYTYTVEARFLLAGSSPAQTVYSLVSSDTGIRPTPFAGGGSGGAGDEGGTASDGSSGEGSGDGFGSMGSGGSSGEQDGSGPGGDGSGGSSDGDRDVPPALPPIGCDELTARIQSRIEALREIGNGDDAELAKRLSGLLPQGHATADGKQSDGTRGHAAFHPACAMLQGDVDLDGSVDADDLDAFVWAWAERDEAVADLDRDGKVTPEDLARLMDAMARHGADGRSAGPN